MKRLIFGGFINRLKSATFTRENGIWFSMGICCGYFVFNDLRGEVIISFVDIVEFYHRLNFFFIKV